MSSVRLLMFDLDGDKQEKLQKDVLEAFPKSHFQFKCESFASSETRKPASQLSAMLRKFLPDVTLLILSDNCLSSIAATCSAFQEFVPTRPWLAVVSTAQQLNEVRPHNPADFLTLPYQQLDLILRVGPWIETVHQQAAPIELLKKRLGLEDFIGESPAVAKLLEDLSAVAKAKAGVLIQGETGTGKELCAKAIHRLSGRGSKNLVTINCAELRDELVEDKLFGHLTGAYTGASHSRAGAIHQAQGGTLFLDEINSLPVTGQGILTRVSQEHEFRALGSDKVQKADFRTIAATNTDLLEMVAEKRFREDLYFRLSQVRLVVPPLRERPQDIVLLAQHFLTTFTAEKGDGAKIFSQCAMEKLVHYPWPGNVRQLKNMIQEVVCFSPQSVIRPEEINLPGCNGAAHSYKAAKALLVADWQRKDILARLAVTQGNASQAARAADQDPRTFRATMRKCGIERQSWPRYSPRPYGK
jgi:two-component system, NtrC family, response regulator GlrR